jgi:predicted cupin superfamily sugar epimerase
MYGALIYFLCARKKLVPFTKVKTKKILNYSLSGRMKKLLNKEPNDEECDTTGDAMKNFSRYQKCIYYFE